MLAEFLIELKLNEERDKIIQIVTGSNGAVKSQCMTSISMLVKRKHLLREKAKEEMVKVASLTGVHLAMSIGRQTVAHKDAIARSIIQADSQDDVQSLALLVTTRLNPRMPSGTTPYGKKKLSGKSSHWRPKSMKLPRARKVKGRGLSLKARVHRSIPRPSQSQTSRNERPQPKAKPEARSCMTNDFLLAMMSTKSKPTWRHIAIGMVQTT